MKIGITSGVYMNYPLEAAVRHVAEAGFDGIDIWCGRPHLFRHDFSLGERRVLRQLLDDLGLSVPSLMPAFYRYPHSLTSPNDSIRRDSLDYMYICIDHAVELGAEVVLIVPDKARYGQTVEDARQRMLDGIDAVCRYAKQYDTVKLGIEPVNAYVSDFMNTAADGLEAIDLLGHDNLGVVMDSGHIHLNKESTTEALEKLGPRLWQFHISDNDGVHQQNLIPGEGTFDFEAFVGELSAAGFDGFLSAELGFHYTFDPDAAARSAAQRMRTMLES